MCRTNKVKKDSRHYVADCVAAIMTAMTDGEQPFLCDSLKAVLLDPCIGQVVLCIDEKNSWINATIGPVLSDPRLCIVRLPIMPVGAVRNKALQHVQKPWVAYCDSDDVWCEGKTSLQIALANETGCDLVGSDHYLMDDDGQIRAFALARYLPMLSSWVVRTHAMRQYPFNEELLTGSDGEWWIRTASVITKTRCPRMLLRYRVRSESLSSPTPSKQRKARIVAYAKVPVLGLSILLLTSFTWFFTRRRDYAWVPSWGQQPSLNQE